MNRRPNFTPLGIPESGFDMEKLLTPIFMRTPLHSFCRALALHPSASFLRPALARAVVVMALLAGAVSGRAGVEPVSVLTNDTFRKLRLMLGLAAVVFVRK